MSLPLSQTASKLLAAAIVELFPNVLLVGGQGTARCFYYDFLFPFEFKHDFLVMIEERMRAMQREKVPIKTLDMMPKNAASLLDHNHQPIVAEMLRASSRTLVQMCQIGSFVDQSPQHFEESLDFPCFKIIEAFDLGLEEKAVIRIVGLLAEDKQFLKKRVKEGIVFADRNHLDLFKKTPLLSPINEDGAWVWQADGEKLRDILVNWWKKEHRSQNFDLITTPSSLFEDLTDAHTEYFLRSKKEQIAEIASIQNFKEGDVFSGCFAPQVHLADRAHTFCKDEKVLQTCISSLQFIVKMPKILDFEFQIVLCVPNEGSQKGRGKKEASFLQKALEKCDFEFLLETDAQEARIEIRIADSLGRMWTGPFLSVSTLKAQERKLLTQSTFGSMERFVALMMERTAGELPLWLAAEQVRLILVSEAAEDYANSVNQALCERGIRATIDRSADKLSARLYHAIHAKVPFMALIGEREEKTGTLTVRTLEEKQESNMSVDALIAMITKNGAF